MGKRKDQGHRRDINTSENGCGAGQGTSAGYEITDGHCLSLPGKPTKGKRLEEYRRDVGETNWMHAEAFGHYGCAMMMMMII